MKTRTVTVTEGEWLGPIDWTFDFFANDFYSGSSRRDELIRAHVDALKEAERLIGRSEANRLLNHNDVEVLIGASVPSWQRLITVGMYDGWPYWKPYPSLLVQGPLGSERMPWHWLSAVRIRER